MSTYNFSDQVQYLTLDGAWQALFRPIVVLMLVITAYSYKGLGKFSTLLKNHPFFLDISKHIIPHLVPATAAHEEGGQQFINICKYRSIAS